MRNEFSFAEGLYLTKRNITVCIASDIIWSDYMFVELIYDKINMIGVPNANALILAELTKRVHGTFPDADVKVKPMVTLSSIDTDASKAQKAVLAGIVVDV